MALRKWWAAGLAVVIGLGLVPRAVRAADSGQGSTPLADDRTLVALAVALACADAPQAEPPAPGGPDLSAPANDGPELELVATVRAKALKFDIVPKTQVVFQGTGRRKTTWKTERVNLPMHPEPGVTYRDVAVRLTVTSDIQELAALLREAKNASAGIQMEADPPAAAPSSSTSPGPGATPDPKPVPAAKTPSAQKTTAAPKPMSAPRTTSTSSTAAPSVPTATAPTATAAPIAPSAPAPSATAAPAPAAPQAPASPPAPTATPAPAPPAPAR
jgi:hypothetical protein